MFINLPILLFGILANLLLGLFVLLRNRTSATNLLFFLLVIDIVLWSIANYFTLITTDLLVILYWTRIVMALAVPQAVIFFLLIHTLPSTRITLAKPWLITLVVLATIATAVCMTPYVFTSVIFVQGSPSPTPGPAIPLFALVAVGSVIAGILTLIKKFIAARGLLRQQLLIMLLGVGGMFGLILFFNFFLVVVLHISSFISFSPLYTLPFVVATAYAIIRHKFFDIRILLARTVSYTILIALFGVLYALVFSLTSTFFITPLIDPRLVAVSTIGALCMLFTFPLLKRVIEQATDVVFYKNKIDTEHVLYQLSETLARSLKLEDLTHQFLKVLNRELRISHSTIILIYKNHVFTVITEGYDTTPEVNEEDVIALAHAGHVIYRDDSSEKIKKFFDDLDVTALLPLQTSQQVIGILGIGGKLSGDSYSQDDINVLEITTPEAAVAIENSLSYEEITRFNITLKDEVSHATRDLRTANEKLEQLDKLKDEFVSLASHELRTPLTSIRSYLWMALSGKGGELSKKEQYYLDRAFSSTNRLIKLVNDMLNISRIESGRISVQLTNVDITKLIEDVVSEVRPRIEEQELKLTITPVRDIPLVIADSDKIKEVLINFIGNAIKFTPRKGEITISTRVDKQFVVVEISDNGIGIRKEDIDKLFKKFGTVDAHTETNASVYQSTGLGLYISKSIVALHGGTVGVKSDGIGKGSTFFFTLFIYDDKKKSSLQKNFAADGPGIIHTASA